MVSWADQQPQCSTNCSIIDSCLMSSMMTHHAQECTYATTHLVGLSPRHSTCSCTIMTVFAHLVEDESVCIADYLNPQRSCPCYSIGQAEDALHMIIECAAYHEIRSTSRVSLLKSSKRAFHVTVLGFALGTRGGSLFQPFVTKHLI